MQKDLIYAFRNLVRNPGVSAIAILTLALGIGANTAMFSVLYSVLLQPLPLRDPSRLVTIWARIPTMNIPIAHVEYNTFVEWWRARCRSFESMSAFTPMTANLTSLDQPQRVRGGRVSARHFTALGTGLQLGRDFLAEEDRPGAPRVAILSDGLWKRSFGGDPGILGRTIVLDGTVHTVVAVLPAEFDLHREDVFTTIAHSGVRDRTMPSVHAYARLKPGVSLEAAQTEIDALCRGWVQQYRYPKNWGARVWPIRDFMVRDVRTSVVVLAAAVVLVLLIACANVANLLLVAAGARQKEMAIRTALGAVRGRIVRQLLTESALMGLCAAAIALALAWAGVRAMTAVEMPFPMLRKAAVNGPVLAFTMVATLLTTLVFGLAPAVLAGRTRLVENLKEGGRGTGESPRRNLFRAVLVVVEVGLALLLAIGATLTVRSLSKLTAVDPGFNPEGVLTAQITLPQSSYADPGRRANFFRSLLERLAASPGVQSAAMVSHLPFGGSKSGNDVQAEGAPPPGEGEQRIAFARQIDPEYFRAIQVPLLRGRFFTRADPTGAPVAVVNETFAKRLWPGQDPVGKRFTPGRTGPLIAVVGLIRDIRNTSLADEPDAEYFMPYAQTPGSTMSLVVRSKLDPMRLAPVLRGAVGELDRQVPVSEVLSLADTVSRSISARRFSTMLLGGFAALALLLASVGIYGVISHSVERRTREIGVRMALGAPRGGIAVHVVGQALLMAGVGVLIGLAAGVGLTRLLRGMLYGVSATDPLVFTGAAALLIAVSAFAAYVPAVRASRVDPMVALRHE